MNKIFISKEDSNLSVFDLYFSLVRQFSLLMYFGELIFTYAKKIALHQDYLKNTEIQQYMGRIYFIVLLYLISCKPRPKKKSWLKNKIENLIEYLKPLGKKVILQNN